MAIDTNKIATKAATALGHDDCVCVDNGTTTKVTIGPTTFEVDHVDGDGKPRTQAEIEAIIATLCKSVDAQSATDKLVTDGVLVKTSETTYAKTGVATVMGADVTVK